MKRWFKYVLAVIIALAILGICYEVRGQGCPDDYGCALYYRSDIWSRSDLRAHFVFDPGVQGDALKGDGDFETWTGPEGGCTDCPTNWGCDCTTVGGDVDSETTIIYSRDTSAILDADGDLTSIMYHAADYEANTCYQFDFCYVGTDGAEDLKLVAGNAALTDTYNWAANTWAAAQALSLTNIGTTRTCTTAYLSTGAAAKTGYYMLFYAGSADGDEIILDFVRFQRLNACSITGSMGNVLSVAGDPQWGHSEVLLPRVGTGPAYKTGMQLDGVDDYLSCADGTCEMDPINWASGGSFSVGCRVMTDTVAAGSSRIINKYVGAGAQRSWYIDRNAATLGFFISDDGTNIDTNSVTMFTVDAFHSFVSTFDPSGGAAAYENNLYYNAYQVDTDATMTEGAPFNSTAPFEIGGAQGSALWSGSMLECAMWERKLSAVEANKYISPHFPATNHGDGFWVDTCSQAASHATCSTQVCRDGTPNACQSEGTGVMACFDQSTELIVDNSWEEIVGDPSAGTWAEWTKTETPGNGSASVTAYLADAMHGNASARLTLTGTTSEAELESDCIPVAASTAYYSFIKAKELYGTTVMYMFVDLYLAADCSGAAAVIGTVVNGVDVPDGIYTEYGGTFTTLAGINALKIRVVSYLSASSFLVDTVSLKLGTYRKPWNENPSGAGTTTYTSRDYRLHNPLSDFIEAEQKYGYEDGFCVAMWTHTDWDGADAVQHYMIQSPGTVGNNNLWFIRKTTRFEFRVYTAAGVATYRRIDSTADNWTAGYFKYIEACHDNAGTTKARHYDTDDGTWYDWVETSGNAVQDGASTELHIGHATNTSYLDGYTPKIHLSPYPAGNFVWPQKGWNNGIPPVNGRPY